MTWHGMGDSIQVSEKEMHEMQAGRRSIAGDANLCSELNDITFIRFCPKSGDE